MDWIYFEPRLDETYSINTFDDGNDKYRSYANVWNIYGTWRGKVAIVNEYDKSVRIESISEWKLTRHGR